MANRNDKTKEAACTQWEMQLAEVLDGVLAAESEPGFNAHKSTCAACAELYEEARRGQEWLGFLSEEPEIPAGLLERILISTGPNAAHCNPLTPAVAGGVIQMPPVWQRPNFMTRATRFASQHFDTRILMTAAMAFFSIALTLNLSGFRLERIHMGWITPNYLRSIMERRVTAASSPIVRFYDHFRDSYEVDSKVREIQKTTEGLTAPLKDEVKNQLEQNQTEPDSSAPLNQDDPTKTPTNTSSPEDKTPPQNTVTPQSDQQKQSEPKTPAGPHGAEIQLPETRQPDGGLNRTSTTQEKETPESNTEERTLALLTAHV